MPNTQRLNTEPESRKQNNEKFTVKAKQLASQISAKNQDTESMRAYELEFVKIAELPLPKNHRVKSIDLV